MCLFYYSNLLILGQFYVIVDIFVFFFSIFNILLFYFSGHLALFCAFFAPKYIKIHLNYLKNTLSLKNVMKILIQFKEFWPK